MRGREGPGHSRQRKRETSSLMGTDAQIRSGENRLRWRRDNCRTYVNRTRISIEPVGTRRKLALCPCVFEATNSVAAGTLKPLDDDSSDLHPKWITGQLIELLVVQPRLHEATHGFVGVLAVHRTVPFVVVDERVGIELVY